MKYQLDERKEQFRTIFELWYKNPRMEIQEIGEVLELNYRTVKSRIEEAVTQGYIVGPQIRKKSFKPFKEYVHFAIFEDPDVLYQEYRWNKDIIHHAVLDGFCNFSFISEKHFDLEGILVSGDRTDYHISYPPNLSWSTSLPRMGEMVQAFDPATYTPKHYLKTHWDEKIYWTELDETLYGEFKYDFRKPLNTIARKKYNMYKRDADRWLKKVPECCTVFTSYFPESIFAYDSCVYMFETDYEDFLIDVFSLLPTTAWFYRVSNKLFIHTWLDRGSMRSATPLEDISMLHMISLMRNLKKKEIIKSEAHAEVICYWRRE
jgi:hypothetical protein